MVVFNIYLFINVCVCYCFVLKSVYRILWDAEIKMADLTTLKYLSCSLHGQPER